MDDRLLNAIALAGAEREARLGEQEGFYWHSEQAVLRSVMDDLGMKDFIEPYTPEMTDLVARMISYRCRSGHGAGGG